MPTQQTTKKHSITMLQTNMITQRTMKKHLTTMLIIAISAVSSLAIAQEAPDELDASTRLEARLQPVIAVDASGQARLDNAPNMANDRFTAEVEIAKADFDDLGITRGN